MNAPARYARLLAASLVVATALTTTLAGCDGGRTPAKANRLERGRYLVSAMGCTDCHTPWHVTEKGPGPDMSRGLSGHPESMLLPPPPAPQGPWVVAAAGTNTAWAGPWGVSFTANLTPDEETGIGAWTEENFVQAIRNGRHMGRGRPILPPMPWTVFRNLSDEDLASIFTYLVSQPPVKNRVPEPLPPAPAATAN